MDIIIAILCGVFLGGANVIPGVSGGTVAVMLGIYEKFVGSISDITTALKDRKFKELKSPLMFLIPIFVGAMLGIILFSNIISYTLEYYYELTMYSFLGLIIGSVPSLVKKTGLAKTDSPAIYIPMVFTFAIALSLYFLKRVGIGGVQVSEASILWLFVCGIIASSAMIIPGISGSFLLMLIGVYSLIVNSAAVMLDLSLFTQNALVLVPFALGMLVGIIAVSKIMDSLLKKYYKETFLAVIGFVVGSLPILAVDLSNINAIFAIIACVICAVISFLLMTLKKGE
ncbi:MAG: DUF368 domain-containing protein [Bacillota bacterium]